MAKIRTFNGVFRQNVIPQEKDYIKFYKDPEITQKDIDRVTQERYDKWLKSGTFLSERYDRQLVSSERHKRLHFTREDPELINGSEKQSECVVGFKDPNKNRTEEQFDALADKVTRNVEKFNKNLAPMVSRDRGIAK